MEELKGMFVRVVLNTNNGITTISGVWIRICDAFVVLENKNGPIYIALNTIKTVQPISQGNPYEER